MNNTAPWRDYRMWRRIVNAINVTGNTAETLSRDWAPTQVTFRARSQPEAQRKADKFWRDAELGAGSILCIPANEDIGGYL